jgi:hypothetical protein
MRYSLIVSSTKCIITHKHARTCTNRFSLKKIIFIWNLHIKTVIYTLLSNSLHYTILTRKTLTITRHLALEHLNSSAEG